MAQSRLEQLATGVAVVVIARVRVTARAPLRCALHLSARARGTEVHTVVSVTKKQAKARGAHVCSRAVNINGIVAPTESLDPTGGGPLGDAPTRVVLGATMVAWELPVHAS